MIFSKLNSTVSAFYFSFISRSLQFFFFIFVPVHFSFAQIGTTSGSPPSLNICAWTQPIVELQTKRSSAQNQELRADLNDALFQKRQEIADSFFSSYLQGSFQQQMDSACLNQIENSRGFTSLIQLSFLHQSLEFFRRSQSPTLRLLVELLDQKFGRGTIIVFRLSGGNQFEPSPTQHSAGFHRGEGSIFMDIQRVQASEWFVILAHELVHYLDQKIQQGGAGFSDPETAQLMVAWAQRTASPSDLPEQDRMRIERWMEHGLDRGLLAEARAWTITLQIYQEGLRENIWQKTPWLSEILKEKRSDETLPNFSLRYLAARTYQPRESIFTWDLSRNILGELINKFVSGTRTWGFESLEQLLPHVFSSTTIRSHQIAPALSQPIQERTP